MTRRLLLVRHGQIVGAETRRFIGSQDPPLDARGQQQARELCARIRRWAPQTCYCSPLRRCLETAQAAVPEMAIQYDEQLREINFGQWEGQTFEEIARHSPELVSQWAQFAWDFAFPDGEALDAFLTRVRSVAERLSHDPAETVLAIAHGGVIRTLLCHFLGLEPRFYVAFRPSYAALAVLDLHNGRGVLSALESTDLPEMPRG